MLKPGRITIEFGTWVGEHITLIRLSNMPLREGASEGWSVGGSVGGREAKGGRLSEGGIPN